jgi:hypothetical protein
VVIHARSLELPPLEGPPRRQIFQSNRHAEVVKAVIFPAGTDEKTPGAPCKLAEK